MDLMLFDLDLEQNNRHRMKSNGDEQTPCAPPPSPNLRRKGISVPMLPLSKLFHSCEDLINRTSKISIGTKSPLHSKRKTSDRDDMDTDSSCSSSGSSPGSSSPDLSYGKRSRTSLDFDSLSTVYCLSRSNSSSSSCSSSSSRSSRPNL